MPYDPMTLWMLVTFIIAMMSALLLVTFLTTARNPALIYWAGAMAASGLGIFAIAARRHIPDFASIELGNGAILIGASLMWNGLRAFDGRRPEYALPLGALALWLAACQFPLFATSIPNRVMLMTVLVIAMHAGATRDALRGGDRGGARSLMIGLLVLHVLVLASRLVAVHFVTFPDESEFLRQPNLVIGAYGLANVAFLVLFTFAAIAMVRDRQEQAFRRASLLDDLTGLMNRRGFMDSAPAACQPGRPFAVMALDLDRFKDVNDRHGHAAGDALLVLFAQVLRAELRASDVVARTGGEEFGVLMPGASAQNALEAAERVRLAFRQEAAAMQLDGVAGTVSIGLAVGHVAPGGAVDIAPLLARADAALYSAKAKGRDRVETARPEPVALRVVGQR